MKRNKKRPEFIDNTKDMISYVNKSVEYFYDSLIQHIPGSTMFVIRLCNLMNGHSTSWYKWFMFYGIVFPRVLIGLTLLLEVYYFHRVYLFFYVLPLVLIPLLTKALVAILVNTYENNIKGVDSIVFKLNAYELTHEPITVYGFRNPEWNELNLDEEETDIDYFVDNIYLPILALYDTATILANLRLKYTYRVRILTVIMYGLSGIYLLLAVFE